MGVGVCVLVLVWCMAPLRILIDSHMPGEHHFF